MKASHVVKRGRVYHFRAVVGGKVYSQSLHTRAADVAKARADDLYQSAVKGLWRDVEQVIRPAAVDRRKASLEDVSAAFRSWAAKLQRPAPQTVAYAVQAMLRVARCVHSCSSAEALKLSLDDVLLPSVQDRYADVMMARDGDSSSTRVSICSCLRTAKQVISRDMVTRLRRMVPGMPSAAVMEDWRAYKPIPEPDPEDHEFTDAEGVLLRAAGDKLDGAAWMAWAMGFYAALRAGEAEAAKWSWLVRYVPTAMERSFSPWLAGRDFVWILRVQGTKTAASVADVPLHDSVADMFLARRPPGSQDDDYMLGITAWQREEAIRSVSKWFRDHGWVRNKTTHALRAFRIQAWFNARGMEARYRWGRHALKGMDAHYLARRYLGAEPLPADQ